jgi:hypothetical protein
VGSSLWGALKHVSKRWGSSPRGAFNNDSKRPGSSPRDALKNYNVFVDVGLVLLVAQALKQTGRRHIFIRVQSMSNSTPRHDTFN